MRILLINPPYSTPFIREGRCQSPQSLRKNSVPQMTLAYLAGVLERAGHEIIVFDCIASEIRDGELFAKIGSFGPVLAFVNTTTPTISSDLQFIRGLKARYPTIFTVAFGAHVTALHKVVMESSSFLDAVIRNEPEFTAVEIARWLNNGPASDEIAGCTMRRDGEVRVFADRNFEKDLDALGFPAWQYLPLNQYVHPIFNKPYLMVNTGRGCRHRCIFCVAPKYYGRSVRHRSPESVVREIRRNVEEFGVRHFWFYADDFTDSPSYVKELCREIIAAQLKIVWWSNTRGDKLDKDMFLLMKRSGCFMLSIGGESGSQDLLRRMRKGIGREDIVKTVTLLRNVGINSLVYFLIGLPGETKETIRESIRFAQKANSDYVEFYPATPYPGTEFFELAAREGLINESHWENYQYSDFVIDIPGLDKQTLKTTLSKAYFRFYLRPRTLILLLKRARHPSEFIRLVNFGWGYFRKLLAKA